MSEAQLGVMIPILAIVFGVSAAMLFDYTNHRRKSQLLEQIHKERLAALERGLELPAIPPGLAGSHGDYGAPSAARTMRNGLVLFGIGVVLYFALGRIEDEAQLFGLIPGVIGIANLIYAAVLSRKESAAATNLPAKL
jgi:hypothetical protein